MKQEVFPSNVIASFFRFKPSEFFSIPESERAVPRVSLKLSLLF
jgi:hypothetical protein